MIRKAYIEDKKRIMTIIRDAAVDMESKGIHQWDDIYPNEEVISNDLNSGALYVFEDDENIKGLIVLNEYQDKEYEGVDWKFNFGKQLVVHRLCVDPHFQGQGVARQLMMFAEEYGKELHYDSIRLDAFTENSRSCNLYEKLGFIKVGIVSFRKGKFYCFERELFK